MNNYRLDTRSEEEFKNDIKDAHIIERQLMERYVKYLNERPNATTKYSFKDNGIDNTGNYIHDSKDVSLDADFILISESNRNKKIEIKHCKPKRSSFHLKIPHVKFCIKNDICIVNWMGIDTDDPKFCILTPAILEECLKSCKHVFFWKKPCIKLNCKQFEWISG